MPVVHLSPINVFLVYNPILNICTFDYEEGRESSSVGTQSFHRSDSRNISERSPHDL